MAVKKRLRRLGQRLAAVALVVMGSMWAAPAVAADLVVGEGQTVSLGGEQLRDSVTINGELKVLPYDGSPGRGVLHLRAKTIVIGDGGLVDASNAGYRGDTVNGGEGFGDTGAGETGDLMLMSGTPGGGGAHIGAGGPGHDGSCVAVPGTLGGSPYDSPSDPLGVLGLGSAGGTSHAGGLNPGQLIGGGSGGGVIILEAEMLDLRGTIRADGQTLMAVFGTSPGGGAGGTIILRALDFNQGANVNLSASGGDGPQDNANSYGGGGGGGLILLQVPGDTVEALALAADVSGGASGCPGGDGMNGLAQSGPPPTCLDNDQDGFQAASCGGEDCDDYNPDTFPGAAETCDGVDNNCNEQADEDDAALCPVGANLQCVAGECVAVSSGSGGGAPANAPPKVELGGGLCSYRAGSSSNKVAPWLLLGALLGLGRRRPG